MCFEIPISFWMNRSKRESRVSQLSPSSSCRPRNIPKLSNLDDSALPCFPEKSSTAAKPIIIATRFARYFSGNGTTSYCL